MTKPEHREVALRAFAEVPNAAHFSETDWDSFDEPSDDSLIIDCETRTTESQALRFGVYQIRHGARLVEEGIFFEPEVLSGADEYALRIHAEQHGLKVLTRDEFIHTVFFNYAFNLGARVIGFNLPFDLSRLAEDHGDGKQKKYGWFSLKLGRSGRHSRVHVLRIDRRASLISFGRTGGRGHFAGAFLDIGSLAGALFGRPFSLKQLCERLETTTRKRDTDEHDQAISPDYIEYARADVRATWECFEKLQAIYDTYELETPSHKILTEASLGKATLQKIGVKPFLELNPDCDKRTLGKLMSAFFGGRAEIRIRRNVVEVLYCDFRSMYPTVNALMGLWRYFIADGWTQRDATDEIREFVEGVTEADLQNPETWKRLPALVRVRPNRDVFPVRATYSDDPGRSDFQIGLNEFGDGKQDYWFSLPDVIASKLHTGRTPEIVEAIAFDPGPVQHDLKPIDLFGNPNFRIDPLRDDAFVKLVDMRGRADKATADAIKIIVNAMSYGITIEIIRKRSAKKVLHAVYPGIGARRMCSIAGIEEPGKFFNPLLGVMITGAARLMLTIAERRVLADGLEWAMCDTDSLAIARPDGVSRDEFRARVDGVRHWFDPLNPYEDKRPGSILKLEKQNFGPGGGLEPLFCWAISAKRYALFNIKDEATPVIRKASAHGLGYLMPPYGDDDAPAHIPAPLGGVDEIGVHRWQHDYWWTLLAGVLAGDPDEIDLAYHPALQKPAMSRYAATSPGMLKRMTKWNAGKRYHEQVRPFGFMVQFFMRDGLLRPAMPEPEFPPKRRGRPRKEKRVTAYAPFERDPFVAAKGAFDPNTGKSVAIENLKTYEDALSGYHLSSESKFLNGDGDDKGETRRRRIVPGKIRLIGKETNRLDDGAEGVMENDRPNELGIVK